MEKTLSKAQQDQLMNTAKEDFLMKKEIKSFQEANKTWEESIIIISLGD